MIVAVGSINPTKIRPVEKEFLYHFKNVKVVGVEAISTVEDQPMSAEEMYKGALARAIAAIKIIPDADYGVGIEGGINKLSFGMFEQSLVVIINRKGKIGIGSSGGLVLPQKVINLIIKGKTLEQAVDEIFGTEKIGRGIGMFGIFTKGTVTREQGVRHGVAFALARFHHEELYDNR